MDKDKADYHPIVNIGQHFAKQGKTVRITPRVHVKSPEYKTIYGGLIGTIPKRVIGLTQECSAFPTIPNR